jgi:hypothetical protein
MAAGINCSLNFKNIAPLKQRRPAPTHPFSIMKQYHQFIHDFKVYLYSGGPVSSNAI